ncbi:hypothetical protein APHAL10511_005196 [Amanita phalloides]|nr:hypothetical protein APHAL10511_005196 [Amanita phalloides]
MRDAEVEEELVEEDSLTTLVADLDDSFWCAVPTPVHSPLKSKKSLASSSPLGSPLKRKALAALPASDNDDAPRMLQDIQNFNWDRALPSIPKKSQPLFEPQKCTRCTVVYIEDLYSNGRYQKVLTVTVSGEPGPRTVILQDDWVHSSVMLGDTIHAIGSFTQPLPFFPDAPPSITINSKDNFIILHPDLLTTITAVSTASQCRRRPLLSGLVRFSTDYTPALVWGNMLHEVMQTCLSENRWEASYIDEQIELVLSNGLTDLVRIDTSIGEARRELRERSKGLQAFAAKYLSQTPKPEAVVTNTRDTAADVPSLLAIADVLDIEEDIWSPTYGLRGKLDATVFAHTAASTKPAQDSARSNFFSASSASPSKIELLNSCPTPFEIKTGRANAGTEHRAQTMLYTLLAEERYGSDVPAGLLYYTQSEEVVRVPRSRNEVRALIATRNELASWMMTRSKTSSDGEDHEDEEILAGVTQSNTDMQRIIASGKPFLPPTIDNERTCKRCYVLDTCMLYRKAVENVIDHDSPIADTYKLKTSHLSASHCDFFKTWEALLSYEERDIIRFKKELWTLRAEERERKGRCFAGMVLDATFDPSFEAAEYSVSSQGPVNVADDTAEADSVAAVSSANVTKIHRRTYRFIRSPTHGRTTGPSESPPPSTSNATYEQPSLLNGHISVGDAITVSVEPHLLALARGYVLKLTATNVTIGVDHDISLDSVKAKLAHMGTDHSGTLVFRIDRDELFGGMSRMRNNLAQLFYDKGEGNKRLRELIVDLEAPLFHNDVPQGAKKMLKKLLVESRPALKPRGAPYAQKKEQITWGLNQAQIQALRKIISAQDYAMVHGMPGTGKTTVIAALICILVQLGKTVLLTSYTHSAVDTILLKMDSMGSMNGNGMCDFEVLRIGNVDKVHPQVRKYTLAARSRSLTIEQLEGRLMTPPVIATTSLSIDHALFNRRRFDYCIVDEASQITLPTCLGPLRFADTFVLVGDHLQLPPLVRNPIARRGGLDISLFRRLSDAHPGAIVELAQQYRMNRDIMLLSNKLIYGDRLRCGTNKIAKQSLEIANWSFVNGLHLASGQGCLAPFELERNGISENGRTAHGIVRTKAVFVNTDLVPAKDSRAGDLVQNTVEAELVYQTVESLLQSGVGEDQIGIISLYRQQIKLISQLLRHRPGIEILTADRSQGRDKDCIIISMVRSNDAGHTGDLVKDWRRMNVSFTRARRKLVIFGSRSTLQGVQLLDDFFQLMEGNGWILQLPPGADDVHRHAFVSASRCSMDVDQDALLDKSTSQAISRTSNKRLAVDDEDMFKDKENRSPVQSKARKKLKTAGTEISSRSITGILKGRSILQDLVNEEA